MIVLLRGAVLSFELQVLSVVQLITRNSKLKTEILRGAC
jgi:hypothetical protein